MAKYDLVGATGCATGVAHTFMAEEALEKLPPLVLRALAHALDYLKQFHLEAIVRQKCAFRPFSEANEMTLSPNTLQ